MKTRLSLTGPLVVARDIAHAKIAERLDAGEPMPAYLRDHAVYYAGPAKTPEGYASGSFGPTTAGRMDSYVDKFQAAGGSLVMLAKGNRSKQVTEACQTHGGFYLGSIGGPAARLAQDCIRHVEVLEYPELGMEAVWRIEVEDFPAFIVVDDKGNDFFADPSGAVHVPITGVRMRTNESAPRPWTITRPGEATRLEGLLIWAKKCHTDRAIHRRPPYDVPKPLGRHVGWPMTRGVPHAVPHRRNRARDERAQRHRDRLLPAVPRRLARPRRARQDHRALARPAPPATAPQPAPSSSTPPSDDQQPARSSDRLATEQGYRKPKRNESWLSELFD